MKEYWISLTTLKIVNNGSIPKELIKTEEPKQWEIRINIKNAVNKNSK